MILPVSNTADRAAQDDPVGLVIVMVVVCVVEWFVYSMVDSMRPTCFLESTHGGQSASRLWAALVGLSLLAVVGLAAFRWRRRFLLLFLGFALLYGAALVGLWYASPTIWGPETC
jgi:hypothetical protein